MTAARGRHAPPPEVRLPLQRQRLLRAAAVEFAQRGYAGSSSESISRRAGMSKATFYEHFANKEECILALFEMAARGVQDAMASAVRSAPSDARERIKAGTRAFLAELSEYPEFAQTLLVEIIGAGPRAAQYRDRILQAFAEVIDTENAAAARRGLIGRFASPHDTFAVVGAIAELVSRQVRLGVPEDVLDLAPVIERLIFGLTPPADRAGAG
ncbi:MAG: TetR/AcrR family transcriptional regulator [Solirubrobacteraceae bacterium]